MTEILGLPATSGDIFKEKSLLVSPIVSVMRTHTHAQTYVHASIYIYSMGLHSLAMCVVICISAHTYIHICTYIYK